jgi:hypothetical protein
LLKKVFLNLLGTVADSICCQILWFHSLASVDEAVRTISGDFTGGSASLKARDDVGVTAQQQIRVQKAIG